MVRGGSKHIGGSHGGVSPVAALLTVLAAGVLLLVFLFFVVIMGQEEAAPKREPGGFPADEMRSSTLSTGGPTPSALVGTTTPPPASSPSFLGTGIASPAVVVVEATLGNDQDHDGNYDGMADPLVVLLLVYGLAVTARLVLLVPPACGFWLRLGEPSMLVGCDHHPPFERPG